MTYFNTLLFPLILPAVLAKKARERMTGPDDSTNLSTPLPGFAHRALAAVMGSERHLVSRWQLPFGHSIVAMARRPAGDADADADQAIVERVLPYTMTGERACWRADRGGRLLRGAGRRRARSPSAASGAAGRCSRWSLTLQELGVDDRDIYLYDTFEGMTAPTEARRVADHDPPRAGDLARGARRGRRARGRELFDADDVQRGGGPRDGARQRLPGRSASTSSAGRSRRRCPTRAPEPLALLRLDTDWYESTRHELEHLYPRLSPGGVLIVDDYGHWQGARRAVDEYFAAQPARCSSCSRIDYTGAHRGQALNGQAPSRRGGEPRHSSRVHGARASRASTACWPTGLRSGGSPVRGAPPVPPRRRRPRAAGSKSSTSCSCVPARVQREARELRTGLSASWSGQRSPAGWSATSRRALGAAVAAERARSSRSTPLLK